MLNLSRISFVLKKIYLNLNQGQINEIHKKEIFLPWFTYPAIFWTLKNINASMKVFEYGSGNSTLFLSQKVKELVSIEHNKQWFDDTQEKLKQKNISTTYQLIEPTPINQPTDNHIPGNYLSAKRNESFKNYSESISKYPDNYFDIIIIDGRARMSCLHHAISKVASEGYIILDNSERRRYLSGIKLLRKKGFKQLDFCGFGQVWDSCWITSIFQKLT